ncbi:hypothetical protein HDU78_006554 [Chytriomyces hyalinus]|nr:hypothetical protein HDU78_006554 [Chytriomyces hyalinus]
MSNNLKQPPDSTPNSYGADSAYEEADLQFGLFNQNSDPTCTSIQQADDDGRDHRDQRAQQENRCDASDASNNVISPVICAAGYDIGTQSGSLNGSTRSMSQNQKQDQNHVDKLLGLFDDVDIDTTIDGVAADSNSFVSDTTATRTYANQPAEVSKHSSISNASHGSEFVQQVSIKEREALVAKVASLQKEVALATAELSKLRDASIADTAQWEKDFEEFEDNRARVTLLTQDVSALEADNARLTSELDAQKLRAYGMEKVVKALEAEISNLKGSPVPTERMLHLKDTSSNVETSIDLFQAVPPSPALYEQHIIPTHNQQDTALSHSLTSQLESKLENALLDKHLAEKNAAEMFEIVEIANTENARISHALQISEVRNHELIVELDVAKSQISILQLNNQQLASVERSGTAEENGEGHALATLKAHVTRLEGENTTIQLHLESTKAALAKSEALVSSLQSQMALRLAAEETNQKRERDRQSQQQQHEQQQKILQSKLASTLAELDAAEREKSETESRTGELASALEASTFENARLLHQLRGEASKMQALETQLESLSELQKRYDSQAESWKRERHVLEQHLVSKAGQVRNDVSSALQQKDGVIALLEKEGRQLRDRLSHLESQIHGMQQELFKRESALNSQRQQCATLNASLEEKDALAKSSDRKHQMELSRMLDERNSMIRTLQEEMKSVEEALRVDLEMSKTEMSKTLEEKNAAIRRLETELETKITTSAELENIYQSVSRRLEEQSRRLVVVEDERARMATLLNAQSDNQNSWQESEKVWAEKLKATIIALEKEKSHSSACLANAEAQWVAREQDVTNRLQHKIDEHVGNITELNHQLSALKRTLEQNQEDSKHLRNLLESKESALISLHQENAAIHLSNDSMTQLKTEMEEKLASLQREIVELQDNCIEFSDLNQLLEEQLEEAVKQRQEIQEQYDNQSLKCSILEEDVKNLKSTIEECLLLLWIDHAEYQNSAQDESSFNALSLKSKLSDTRHYQTAVVNLIQKYTPQKNAKASVFQAILACLEHLEGRRVEINIPTNGHSPTSPSGPQTPSMRSYSLSRKDASLAPPVSGRMSSLAEDSNRPSSRSSNRASPEIIYATTSTSPNGIALGSYSGSVSTSGDASNLANLLYKRTQDLQRAHKHIDDLQRDASAAAIRIQRDTETIGILRKDLMDAMHRSQQLLDRIRDAEEMHISRVRDFEEKERMYLEEIDVISQRGKDFLGQDVELIVEERCAALEYTLRADFEQREGELLDSIKGLEDSLFNAVRQLNGDFLMDGHQDPRRILDETFRQALSSLQYQRAITDDMLQQRNMHVQVLQNQLEDMKKFEAKTNFLEGSIWRLIQETVQAEDPSLEIHSIDEGLLEVVDTFRFYRDANDQLNVWRSDLIFQKTYFALKTEDLLHSQRLLLAQLGSGDLQEQELDPRPRRKWKRAYFVVVAVLRLLRR